MKSAMRVLMCIAVAAFCFGQEDLKKVLSFETEHPGGWPGGWKGGPVGTIFVDENVVHSGRWSVRLERTASSKEDFSVITKTIPMKFTGKRIDLFGWLKLENVSGMVGLWLREDSRTGKVLELGNMWRRQLKGTHDWAEYSEAIPINPKATELRFGFLMFGTGKAWADDLDLYVDGKLVWELPQAIKK
jgi:hypothetical protein